MRIEKDFFLFCAVGAAGFFVDAGVLTLFYDAIGPYGSRALSFFCAVIFTWYLNRSITFKARSSDLSMWEEFVSYAGFMVVGGAVNYVAYIVLILWSPFVANAPVVGVAVGSLLGMLINFATSKYILFRRPVS